MSKGSKMPPIKELEKQYGGYLNNPGFRSAHDRSDPCFGTAGEDGDEDRKVLAAIEGEDDEKFVRDLANRVRETTGL